MCLLMGAGALPERGLGDGMHGKLRQPGSGERGPATTSGSAAATGPATTVPISVSHLDPACDTALTADSPPMPPR